MARIRVIADDGWVALDERVTATDFDSEHFRRHLVDRLGWAAADAEVRESAAVAAPEHDERFRRDLQPA